MGNTCQCCPSRPPVISPSRHKGSPVLPIAPSSSLTIPTTSTSSPPHSADGFIQTIEQFPLTDQINPLIDFIEFQLQRIKGSSEEAPSSSPLTSAAQFINAISTEAKNLVSEDIAKEMGELALSGLKKVGKAHWLFLGLSVAAHALERCATVTSNASNCIELLQAIVDLAKDLKRFKEVMPDESERLCRLVQIIVEGAVMCTDYINKGRLSRFGTLCNTFIYFCGSKAHGVSALSTSFVQDEPNVTAPPLVEPPPSIDHIYFLEIVVDISRFVSCHDFGMVGFSRGKILAIFLLLTRSKDWAS